VLVLFFATQFFTAADAGVAWQAHVGGMAAGALLALLLLPLPAVRARRRPPRQGPRATPPPVPVAF
jgi:membrane associated rhomboid family serine protease